MIVKQLSDVKVGDFVSVPNSGQRWAWNNPCLVLSTSTQDITVPAGYQRSQTTLVVELRNGTQETVHFWTDTSLRTYTERGEAYNYDKD